MGCWTTYCCFCGGPPDSIGTWFETFEKILGIIKSHLGARKFKKEYEKKCEKWLELYKELKKERWLDKWGAMLRSGKYISASAGGYDCSGSIEFKNYRANVDMVMWKELPGIPAVAVHKICYNLALKKNKNINWFEYVAPHMKISWEGPAGYVKGINYGTISKYTGQDYAYNLLIEDLTNPWFLKDPTKNDKNRKRINGILDKILKKKPLVKKKPRPSPAESATKFAIGTEKKGGDGNTWVVKKNKAGVKQWRKV